MKTQILILCSETSLGASAALCHGCVPPEPEEGELLQGKCKGSVEADGYLGNQ